MHVFDLIEKLDISSTFNVANMYKYHEGVVDEYFIVYYKDQIHEKVLQEITQAFDERILGRTRKNKEQGVSTDLDYRRGDEK